jgi:plasmid replication initiation protein
MRKKTGKNKGITLIKKSNELIEARYKFDVWETRIFLSVLSYIRREDEDFKTYRIWYKDVIKTFGLKSGQSYGLLRDAARGLMLKVFKVSNSDSGFQRDTEYHIIRSVNYLSEGEKGKAVETQEYIDITFEPEMKPLLLQLQKNFTAYDLRNVVKLGTYPVRVYELLKQYETIGERTLGIEEMKRMFELAAEYPLFANFYQKVIEPSVREINEHTDLTITAVHKVKEGKKVVALRFVFELKDEEELRRAHGEVVQKALEFPIPGQGSFTGQPVPENAAMPEKDRLFNLFHEEVVQKLGVTPSVFLDLLDHCSEDDIQQALRVTRRAKMASQIKTSVAGFFVHALKNGYTDPKEEEARRKAAEAAEKARAAQLRQQREVLQEEMAMRINDRIREITGAVPDVTDRAIQALRTSPIAKPILEAKAQALQHPLTVEDFRQDKILRDMVINMIVEMEKDRFLDILEEFEARMKG